WTYNNWGNIDAFSGQSISGIFAQDHWAATIADITDGTANTIMMGETLFACLPQWTCYDTNIYGGDDGQRGFGTAAPINFPTCPQDVKSIPTALMGFCGSGGKPPTSEWQNASPSGELGVKSMHPSGAQVLMCDGSARFLNETINYETYQRMGDRRDGRQVEMPGQ
ncbi:MAG: DUF1559 domain-containing protein, partial [Pirellulales bacterium]